MEKSPQTKSLFQDQACATPYVLLALLCIVCHGVLLLCDYKIWDGWLVENWQRNHRIDVMHQIYFEAGIQHHYYVHRLFGLSSHRLWLYKFFSLLCYFGIAAGFFHITTRTKFLNRQEAFLASSFLLTFPGMMTLGEAAVFPYVCGTFFFFLACCVAIEAEFRNGARHFVFRVLAIGLFFLGFTYYATLVLYLAFYLLLLWFINGGFAQKREQSPSGCVIETTEPQTTGGLLSFLRKDVNDRIPVVSLWSFALVVVRRIDYLVLPIVFWLFKIKFMKPYGHFGHYNEIQISLSRLVSGYHALILNSLASHFRNLRVNLLVIFLSILIGLVLSRRRTFSPRTLLPRLIMLAVAGIFLIFLGGFSFVSVGKPFATSGYISNYNLLIPIGAGLLLTALLNGIRSCLPRDRAGIVANVIFAFLLINFINTWNLNYLHWQALGAKDRAVAYQLEKSAVARSHFLFQIRDQFLIPLTDQYPTVVRAVQMQDAFDDLQRFGFNVPESRLMSSSEIHHQIEASTVPFVFTTVDIHGAQAFVSILPGKEPLSPARSAVRYLWLKHCPWKTSAEMDHFLGQFAQVNVRDIQ